MAPGADFAIVPDLRRLARTGILEQFQRTAGPDLQDPLVANLAAFGNSQTTLHKFVIDVDRTALHDGYGPENDLEEPDSLVHVRNREPDMLQSVGPEHPGLLPPQSRSRLGTSSRSSRNKADGSGFRPRTMSDAFSPIIVAAAFVLEEMIVGMTELSQIRRPSMP